MPFVEYSSSSQEATRAQEAVLRNHEFGVSMMERATRNRAMLQDIEQRKVRFVSEQIMDDQQIQMNRHRLAEMEANQQVGAAQRRTAIAELDAKSKGAMLNEQRLEEASTVLPDYLRRLETESDPYAIDQIAADFMDRYGRLAENPQFADRFAPIAAEVSALLKSRKGAFLTRVRSATEAMRPALLSNDPESLARVRNSPFFSVAMLDKTFAEEFRAAQKIAAEQASKRADEQQKIQTETALYKAKGEVDKEVNASKAKTDKKEVPQYLAEKAMKIDQSDKDLDDLQAQVTDMATGPLIGLVRSINPLDTNAKVLEAKLRATVPNLARGVFGEVGVLTDADIKNYMATLPNLSTPQDRAVKLVEMLRQVLERQRTNVNSLIEGQGYKTEGIPGLQNSGTNPSRNPIRSGSDLQAAIQARAARRQ